MTREQIHIIMGMRIQISVVRRRLLAYCATGPGEDETLKAVGMVGRLIKQSQELWDLIHSNITETVYFNDGGMPVIMLPKNQLKENN